MLNTNKNVNLIEIAKEASYHKRQDENVINATLGVFLNDSGQIYAFKAVDEALKKIDQERLKSYLANDGGNTYQNNVINHITNNQGFHNAYSKVNWTSGGSGAVYMAIDFFKGSKILLPSLRWPEYDQMIEGLNKEKLEYQLFLNEIFNLNDIKAHLENTDEPILIVINDPAHNPSGYNMTKEDHLTFIDLINGYPKKEITVLYDLAYLDYGLNGFKEEIVPLYTTYLSHVDVYLAFSGSKTFSVYGYRMGALIYLTKNFEKSESFGKKASFKINISHGAPFALSILTLNELALSEGVKLEQEKAKIVLKERSELMLKLLKEKGIKHYPYSSGFFITLKTGDPFKLNEALKQEKVFIVPTNKGIRIALSAINKEEIKRLINIVSQLI